MTTFAHRMTRFPHPRHRRWRPVLALAVAATALSLTSSLATSPAGAQFTHYAYVTAQYPDFGGDEDLDYPLEGVDVCVFDGAGFETCGITDFDGEWVAVLPDGGAYGITFSDPEGRILDHSDDFTVGFFIFGVYYNFEFLTLTGSVACDGVQATHWGSPGPDSLALTTGNDVVQLFDGNDTVNGLAGDDRICGGPGKDRIRGGDGLDIIHGGDDVDKLWGDDGIDVIYGGGGSDRIWGGRAGDVIHAGSGSDRVWGGIGNDQLYGMGGQDRMWGEDGVDILQGNSQSDQLYGGAGNDTLRGAKGKDLIYGESGDDQMYGGDNTDLLFGGVGEDYANGQKGKDRPRIPDVSGCWAETTVSC